MSSIDDRRKIFELHQVIHRLNKEAMDLLEENQNLRDELEKASGEKDSGNKSEPKKTSRLRESTVQIDK